LGLQLIERTLLSAGQIGLGVLPLVSRWIGSGQLALGQLRIQGIDAKIAVIEFERKATFLMALLCLD